jgi:O-antigen ligase
LNSREHLYERARLITRDYPLFGTGPGSFQTVYGLYRTAPDDEWPAQLHNDWLETQLTFGLLGTTLIVLAFAVVLLRWFSPGGSRIDQRLVFSLWLVLAACLVQARWDFPLQIGSIGFLFTFWCAVLFSGSREQVAAVP